MPSQLTIHGMLINSSTLLADSSVRQTQSQFVIDIAQHINTFRVCVSSACKSVYFYRSVGGLRSPAGCLCSGLYL